LSDLLHPSVPDEILRCLGRFSISDRLSAFSQSPAVRERFDRRLLAFETDCERSVQFVKKFDYDASTPFCGILATFLKCATFCRSDEFPQIVVLPFPVLICATACCVRTRAPRAHGPPLSLYAFLRGRWQSLFLGPPTDLSATVYSYRIEAPLFSARFGFWGPADISAVEFFGSVYIGSDVPPALNISLSVFSRHDAFKLVWTALNLDSRSPPMEELRSGLEQGQDLLRLLEEAIATGRAALTELIQTEDKWDMQSEWMKTINELERLRTETQERVTAMEHAIRRHNPPDELAAIDEQLDMLDLLVRGLLGRIERDRF
jgi:hypothetical protein